MLGEHGRGLMRSIFTPAAKLLAGWGVTPNMVTIAGTTLTVITSVTLLATGHTIIGPIVVSLILFADSLDGNIARISGKTSELGAMLDSTLDRIGDGAVFGSLAAYLLLNTNGTMQIWAGTVALAALVLGGAVPYARAKAESLGVNASRGIAERTDRLVVALACMFLVGLGLPFWVLPLGLSVVSLGSAITVYQRIKVVAASISTSTDARGRSRG